VSRSKGVALVLGALAIALVPAACAAGDDACLRMSDCEAPYQCVDGTCRSDETLGIQPGGEDAGASEQ
jgi:hypothetical protein